MNFENPSENSTKPTYEALVQAQIDSGQATNKEEAVKSVELALFNERIGQFTEADLTQDADGSWKTFEQKVRDIYPEFPEDRFGAIKVAVTLHLCGQ